MRTLFRILSRTVFWSYERGTWPYDVAVTAIVVFVLLTPRHWFHDEPQVGPPSSVQGVVLLAEDPATSAKTYRVDARLLASPVRKHVREFQGRTFQIVRIEPVRGENGTVVSYDIWVKP